MNNNYNSCVEGCNTPSSPNEIKILLNQIKREIKELATTTEAKLLCHDGKIAEMCKYIKDNLSNSIRCLLDSMLMSGELEEIIVSIISNDLEILNNHFIFPEKFGAVGNGKHDDTIALQKACNFASENKIPLMLSDKHYIISDSISISDNLTIKGISQNTEIEQITSNKNIFECLTTIDNLHIDTIYLHGVNANDTSTEYEKSCLWLCGCTNSSFKNIKFGKSDDSQITLRYSQDGILSNNILIDNCEFFECVEGSPIELFFTRNVNIRNCYFHDNNINATRYDIRMLQGVNVNIDNCKFENSFIGIICANGSTTSFKYPKIQTNNININNCEFINIRSKAIQTKGSHIQIRDCRFINKEEVKNSAIEINYQNLDSNIEEKCDDITVINSIFNGWFVGIDVKNNTGNIKIINNEYTSNNNSDTGFIRIFTDVAPHGHILESGNMVFSPLGTKVFLNLFSGTPVNSAKYVTITNNTIYEPNSNLQYPMTRAEMYKEFTYVSGNSFNFVETNQ